MTVKQKQQINRMQQELASCKRHIGALRTALYHTPVRGLAKANIPAIPLEERQMFAYNLQQQLRQYGSERYKECYVAFQADGISAVVFNVQDTKPFVRWYPAIQRSILNLKDSDVE